MRACQRSGVERRRVYEWLEHDPHFLAAFHEAKVTAVEVLEAEMFRRAVEGVEKPVYQGKELVGTVREFSDTMLIFALKGNAPEKYRERHDVTTGGEPITFTIDIQRAGASADRD